MIRFGLIGCGSVSGTYLYTLSRIRGVEVVAVADTALERAKIVSERFKISGVYSDYKEMLHSEQLDAVAVCTPHFLHREQSIGCFEKGLDVLCEKPLATNMKDILDMLEKGRARKFGVMLQRRFYPNSQDTQRAIAEGRLGDINHVSLDFNCHKTQEFYNSWRGKAISGGGTLMSQALHRLDQLVYFFGPAKSVEGEVRTTRDYIEVEDYARGKIFFGNGVTADIVSNNSSGNPATISIIKIIGSKGRIVLSDDKTVEWQVPGMPKPKEISLDDIPSEYRPQYYGPAHEKVIDDFVSSISEGKKLSITAADSLPVMGVLFAFYRSANEKKRIQI